MSNAPRLVSAAILFLLGIAIPETVEGTVFLIILWSVIGVLLVTLLVTWEPVRRRIPVTVTRKRPAATANMSQLPTGTDTVIEELRRQQEKPEQFVAVTHGVVAVPMFLDDPNPWFALGFTVRSSLWC